MEWLSDLKVLYLIGAVNALFFSILIFSKQQKSLADKILGCWLIVLSIQVLYPYLYLRDLTKYEYLMGYEASISVLQPAGLYFYTKAMVGKLKWDKSSIIILSSVLFSGFTVFVFMTFMPDTRMELITDANLLRFFELPGKIIVLALFMLFISVYVYLLLHSSLLLKKYKKNIRQVYSNSEKIDLKWLRKLVFFFYAIYGVLFFSGIIFYLTEVSLAYSDYLFYLMMVVFIFLLGYWGHQQGSIFSISQITNHQKKAFNSDISEQPVSTGFEKEAQIIKNIMVEKKPYLEPMLTIHELAGLVDTPPHQLSKIIHKEFKKNFYEFINYYRIEYFKELIISNKYKNFTILAVAYECGFNSKSAFNRIFKEQTGKTPRDYKQEMLSKKKKTA